MAVNSVAASRIATLHTLTGRESVNKLQSKLYDIYQIENGFYADGFGDNA